MPAVSFSKSIIVKITFWLVLVVLVGLGIIIGNQLLNLRQAMLAQFDLSRVQITSLLADKMSAALRYNRPDAARRAFQKMADDPRDSLSMLAAFTENGEEVVSFRRNDSDRLTLDRLKEKVFTLKAYREEKKGTIPDPVVLSDAQYTYVAVPVEHLVMASSNMVGVLLTAFSRQSIQKTIATNIEQMVFISSLLTLVFILLLWFLIRQIVVRPTQAISEAMLVLRNQDDLETIPGFDRNDEIGHMARSLDVFRKTMADSYGKIESQNTELRNLIQALEAAEEKYRTIFENATEGIFQLAPAGRFVNANPSMAEILGYGSPEELMAGVADAAAQCYVRQQDFQDMIDRAVEKGIARDVEVRVRKKNGDQIWASQTTRLIRDNDDRILLYEGSLADISERRKKSWPNAKRNGPRPPPRPRASSWPT